MLKVTIIFCVLIFLAPDWLCWPLVYTAGAVAFVRTLIGFKFW